MKIFHDMGVLVDIFGTDAVELTITMEPDPAEADGESTR